MPFVNAGSNDFAYDSRIFWDSTNGRLGVGTPSPQRRLHVAGQVARFRSDSTNTAAIEISASNNDNNVVLSLRGSDGNNAVIANEAGGNIYLRPQGQATPVGEVYIANDGRVRANYDGSASAPTYGFTGSNNIGMYRESNGHLAFASGGTLIATMGTPNITTYSPIAVAGNRTEPITNNGNPWVYRSGGTGSVYPYNQFGNLVLQARSNAANHIVFVAGATPEPVLTVTADGRVRAHVAGSASFPTFSFYDDNNTGIYRTGADSLGVSAGGTARLIVNSSEVRVGVSLVLSPFTGIIRSDNNTGVNVLAGGDGTNNGASVVVYGGDHSDSPNQGQLRADGTIIASWATSNFTVRSQNMTLSHASESRIVRANDTGLNILSGGTTWNDGAVVRVYGANHASLPSRGALYSGSTLSAYWQGGVFSVPNTLSLSGGTGVIRSEGTAQLNVFSGGNSSGNGANVVVHGSTHAVQANRGQLRSGTSVKAYWASFGFVIPTDSALIIPVK